MDKIKVIQHARSYMDKLSKGIDPISGMDSTSLLQQEQLRKCFAFVSDILEEIVDNNGLVNLPDVNGHNYQIVKKKAAFSLNSQQKAKVRITNELINPSSFIKNINAVVDDSSMEKLSLKTVNQWLLDKGYISETKAMTFVNRTIKVPTPYSEGIGIFEQVVVDKSTGETKKELRYSRQAQQFILDNLDEIIKYGKE
ncbi:MAG: hypothetical protein E7432_07165 [Ruminococcaceae bacterium]|nr:hypothetical protein [Oscillospiraceae bacterium]